MAAHTELNRPTKLRERLNRWWRRRHERHLLRAEPSLANRLYEMKRALHGLEGELARDFGVILARAELALTRSRWIEAGTSDAVWRALHELRHILCEHGSAEQCIHMAADVRADLRDRTASSRLTELDQIVERLTHEDGPPAPSLRHRLLHLSVLAAEERESMWRRVNRVMERRRLASALLLACGLVLVLGLPLVLAPTRSASASLGEFALCWGRESATYLLVATCGAMGALLSGLLREDRVDVSSTVHRLEQFAFVLRPRIGAVAALTLLIADHSDLVKIADDTSVGPALLLAAIAAGFSERVLLGQIERFTGDATSPPGSGSGR